MNRRLRAVSLFSVVRRAKRETREWPRARLMARDWRGTPSFRARACTPLTKPEEKEGLLAVYMNQCKYAEIWDAK